MFCGIHGLNFMFSFGLQGLCRFAFDTDMTFLQCAGHETQQVTQPDLFFQQLSPGPFRAATCFDYTGLCLTHSD